MTTKSLAYPRPLLTVGAIVAGSAFLAASAQIAVPLWPVPMTMQTLAVLLIGAVCGSRLGAATVLAYLGEAAVGLPVLASGKALVSVGPTAGYLLGFVLSAWLTGWMIERRVRPSLALLAGSAVVFLPGLLWLRGYVVDWSAALSGGLFVFLPGFFIKAALGWIALRLLPKAA